MNRLGLTMTWNDKIIVVQSVLAQFNVVIDQISILINYFPYNNNYSVIKTSLDVSLVDPRVGFYFQRKSKLSFDPIRSPKVELIFVLFINCMWLLINYQHFRYNILTLAFRSKNVCNIIIDGLEESYINSLLGV